MVSFVEHFHFLLFADKDTIINCNRQFLRFLFDEIKGYPAEDAEGDDE